MPDKLESLAWFSVARGCAFAMLAIGTTMVGLCNEPVLCLKTGGTLALMTCMVLLLKAQLALRAHHRSTELWLMLKPDERPNEGIAQRLVATVRREALLAFAYYFALGAAVLLAGGFAFGAFIGVGRG